MASSGPSVSDQLASFLRGGLGFSAAGAAGWEGNTEVESGFNPGAMNSKEGAVGLQQWEGGRRAALDAMAAAIGQKETDLNAQEHFIEVELRGYPALLRELQTTTDPAQAAADVDQVYERSDGSARNRRIADAQNIYAALSTGRPIGIGGSAASGGSTGAGAGSAGSTSGGVNALGGGFPGGAADPLNWPGDLLGAASGGILKVVLPFATKAAFVLGGLGLVMLGLYRASEPERSQAAGAAGKLAPLLAMA